MGLFDIFKGRRAPDPQPAPRPLEPHVMAALEAMRRPYVRVTFDAELRQLLPTVSKCGGISYFPVGTSVPPEPLIFLAQINFAEVPPIDGITHRHPAVLDHRG